MFSAEGEDEGCVEVTCDGIGFVRGGGGFGLRESAGAGVEGAGTFLWFLFLFLLGVGGMAMRGVFV